MSDLLDEMKMDKTAFSVGSLLEPADERAFRSRQSVEDRLRAVELLRIISYGYDPTTERLQRVLTIAQLGES